MRYMPLRHYIEQDYISYHSKLTSEVTLLTISYTLSIKKKKKMV